MRPIFRVPGSWEAGTCNERGDAQLAFGPEHFVAAAHVARPCRCTSVRPYGRGEQAPSVPAGPLFTARVSTGPKNVAGPKSRGVLVNSTALRETTLVGSVQRDSRSVAGTEALFVWNHSCQLCLDPPRSK